MIDMISSLISNVLMSKPFESVIVAMVPLEDPPPLRRRIVV
jgi:hypothetical protein